MRARTALSIPRSPVRAVAMAVALTLAGCAATEPWRVEPKYQVRHSGVTAGQGYMALARQYEGEGRGRAALEAWRKAAFEDPNNAEILGALGIAEAGYGSRDQAVVALRRAVELSPGQTAPLNNLGYALMLEGHTDEARSMLRQALELDPGHVQARANLWLLQSAPVAATAPTESAEPTPQVAPQVTAAPASDVAPIEPAPPRLQTEPSVPALALYTAEVGVNPPQAAPETQAAIETPPEDLIPPAEPIASAEPASPVEPTPPNLGTVRVEITNGNGVTGMAAWLASRLRDSGLGNARYLSNLPPYKSTDTVVYYRAGFAAHAREVARRIPQAVEIPLQTGDAWRGDVRVVIGHDVRHLAGCTGACRGTVAKSQALDTVVAAR
jgi:Flp pilus assembly protein TadD